MTGSRNWLWAGALLLLLVMLAWGGYRLSLVLFPQPTLLLPWDPACDLAAGPCSTRLPTGGSVTFEIEPRPIPVVQPLRLHVRLESLPADEVEVDFSGIGMNMGYNRVRLQSVEPGRYQGQGMLPVCVRARMDWEAEVLISTSQGLLAVPYRFATLRPGSSPPITPP